MFIERVCVATDGSDLAVRAAQMGALLARAGGGRMLAVSVAQPHFSVPDGAALPDAQAELARAYAAAQGHAATVVRIAQASGVSCETETPLSSTPGPEIVRVAQKQGCDLIVLGTHGENEVERRFAGGVAQYVLACSPIPVLLLRDPRDAAPPDYREDGPPS